MHVDVHMSSLRIDIVLYVRVYMDISLENESMFYFKKCIKYRGAWNVFFCRHKLLVN